MLLLRPLLLLLVLMMMMMLLPAPAAAYPEFFVARHAKTCSDLPQVGRLYGNHQAVKLAKTSVAFQVAQGASTTSAFRAGQTYDISIGFQVRPRHMLVLATPGVVLKYADQATPPGRACANRLLFGPDAGYSASKALELSVGVPAGVRDASVTLTIVSAFAETSPLYVSSLTVPVEAGGGSSSSSQQQQQQQPRSTWAPAGSPAPPPPPPAPRVAVAAPVPIEPPPPPPPRAVAARPSSPLLLASPTPLALTLGLPPPPPPSPSPATRSSEATPQVISFGGR